MESSGGPSEPASPSVESTPQPISPASPTPTANTNTVTSPTRRKEGKRPASNRRETVILLLVLAFVLNSLNGRKIIESVNSQLDYLTQTYYSEPTAQDGPRPENKTEDTAIIITSSWIPSHPSTYMVEMVVNSTARLKGLSPTAPIFITIDFFRFTDFHGLPPALSEKIEQLEQYAINLFNLYLTDPRIHVIPGVKNNHIGGSVMKAMNLVSVHFPSVKWLYYLQHDFYFIVDVDHSALVKAMDQHSEVNFVRFPKRQPWTITRGCGDAPTINYNRTMQHTAAEGAMETGSGNETMGEGNDGQLKLTPTPAYSDNNHLVRFLWYKKLIASMIKLNRAPEDPLQSRANNGCRGVGRKDDIHGLYLYHQLAIGHLDGRHTASTP